MNAIILSAGQGSRLGHLVDDRSKCLIDFNGRSLLDRQLDTLEVNGVAQAVVVTGFRDSLVINAIAQRTSGPDVCTVCNPFRSGCAEQFREGIERAVRARDGTTIWYLSVSHQLAQQADVWTLDMDGSEWGEVDFPWDVETARESRARWDAHAKAAAA